MGTTTAQSHQVKGLNLRTNQLTKDPNYATECVNVELTPEGYLTKRKGFTEHSEEVGFLQLINYGSLFKTRPDGEGLYKLLGLKSDGLYGYELTPTSPNYLKWVKIPWGSLGSEPTFTEAVSWVEYGGVIYLADPSGSNEIMKFDGALFYRSSCPQPDASLSAESGSVPKIWVKVYYELEDWQGNITAGEDIDLGPISTPFTVNLNMATYADAQFPDVDPLFRRTTPSVRVAVSTHPTFGFMLAGRKTVGGDTTDSIIISASDINNALDGVNLLSDIYDYTIRKAVAPKAKFLDIYNGLMVIGNFTEVSLFDKSALPNVNKIAWSDSSIGGSVEVFPSLNQTTVGKSTTSITGLFGDSDNLIVFKDRNVFYISGDLVSGNYRSRDSLSEGIGCVSHKSIIKVDGGAIFLSEKGLYQAKGGYKPAEFSDLIEPLFTNRGDLILTDATSILDRLNERILIFIPSTTPSDSIIVQYDYYHNQWFILKGIVATGGIVISEDLLYHSDGTKVYVRHDEFNDDGAAIPAKYATGWISLGKPSVKKKFTSFLAFSLDQSTWNLKVDVERNWQETTDTTGIIKFPSPSGSGDVTIPAKQCHSMRFILSNDELDTNMLVNGYEFEFAETQSKYKGRD